MSESHVRSWSTFGAAIQRQPMASLAACFGHRDSAEQVARAGHAVPTLEAFRSDPELDPNPFNLELPDDYLEMCFLVRVLALWGPAVLVEAASACGRLQIGKQSVCAPAHDKARDLAFDAVGRYLISRADAAIADVRRAAESCAALYEPHEKDPDSVVAQKTWYELGAPWFAAETVVQNFSLTEWDGPGPREASSTWGNRVSEWPKRAADAAAHWSSTGEVVAVIKAHIVAFAKT